MIYKIEFRCLKHRSKVFSSQKEIAFSENNIPSIANFVLFSNVHHIKIFFIVKHELGLISIKECYSSYWEEWPHDKLFNHDLSCHTCEHTCCPSISSWINITIIYPFTSSNICPISFIWCPIFMRFSIKNISLGKQHSEIDSLLMFIWDSTIVFI